jgi:hypothetical protein
LQRDWIAGRKVEMTETALTELWPKLKHLSRIEKLRVMHFLALELAGEEGSTSLEEAASYPVWSPYEAFGAADILMQVLKPFDSSGPSHCKRELRRGDSAQGGHQ